MERVLQRVGLSRRPLSGTDAAKPAENEDGLMARRRRRSKSRRRAAGHPKAANEGDNTTKKAPKTRGLFNIDWESMRDCRACKSKALTRRFCSKRCDNELYRSNSFKFERFVRGGDDMVAMTALGEKIPLCEDYSLPLDHLNKRRPNSIAAPSTSDWNISSPNEEKVEVLETYSTPRDSRQQLSQEYLHQETSFLQQQHQHQQQAEDVEQKCFTSPDREYSQPYTTDASSDPSSDEEFFGHKIALGLRQPAPQIELNSPDSIGEAIQPLINVQSPVRHDVKRHPSPYYYSDLLKPRNPSPPPQPPQTQLKQSQTLVSSKSENLRRTRRSTPEEKQRKSHKSGSCAGYHKKYRKSAQCVAHVSCFRDDVVDQYAIARAAHLHTDEDDDEVQQTLDEMSQRQRHVYETAFDCRVSKSDDDLDAIDRVSNHSVLSQLEHKPPPSGHQQKAQTSRAQSSVSGLSQQLEKMHLPPPSPPSTAPLPAKFRGKDDLLMNSIRSAPNLPSHSRTRLKHKDRVLEIKDRPATTRKDHLLLFKRSKDGKGTILEFKARRRRHKYSSTESMTTSSSGGSMESIKSSTSEGNRSTTSTDSRNSSSLSSHDSDSGAAAHFLAAQAGFHVPGGKLHILSPISDKSSQEPVSELSDNNRNNNSPEMEMVKVACDVSKMSRRRMPQNKNLMNLGLHGGDPEIQGSDSGISIQSREGVKSRFALTMDLGVPTGPTDFNDLPFDMPKLRRRRLAAQESACTSSSATSIDFGDLPFDMPKLRRRLRVQPTAKELSVSQASSSQSVIEPDSQVFRPKLSLNLSDVGAAKQKPGLGLTLGGIGGKSPTSQDVIDVNVPLEKQGWYHGAITRVEAENILRLLREGSFLVRNSESTKQDFSLSLKSARGFMHMRIQRDEANGTRSFILGQFSKPFASIPDMIRHFSLNGLPIRGAEHMCLVQPVIVQLL